MADLQTPTPTADAAGFPWHMPDLPNFSNLPDIDLPDLPDLSGLSNIDLPDLPDLNAVSSLAAQIQTVISSAIAHPLWAVAIILLSITLIQIIADLIKRSLKAALTLLLRLPLFISQWIWKRTIAFPKNQPSLSTVEQADQLLARLETLRQEQDRVIADLKALLSEPVTQPAPPAVEPPDPTPSSLPVLEPQPESQIPST